MSRSLEKYIYQAQQVVPMNAQVHKTRVVLADMPGRSLKSRLWAQTLIQVGYKDMKSRKGEKSTGRICSAACIVANINRVISEQERGQQSSWETT